MNSRTLLQSAEAGSLDLTASTLTAPEGIVSRTVLDAPGMRVVLFSFGEGQELTGHSTKRRAVAQILSGECEFLFNDTWQMIKAGTLVHLPPGHDHAVRATSGAFSMLLTMTVDGVKAN